MNLPEGPPQVHVCVKLLGFLSPFSPRGLVDLELPAGASVEELVRLLVANLGAAFQQAVIDRCGNLHGGLEVVLDGVHIPARQISQVFLEHDCEVLLMPMIAGGSLSMQTNEHNLVVRRSVKQSSFRSTNRRTQSPISNQKE